MYTSAGVSLSRSDVNEWIWLVTYLITCVPNDRLDTKCMEPAAAAALQLSAESNDRLLFNNESRHK